MRSILNIEKLKEKARKLEAKGQLDKAIRMYEKLLSDLEGKPELADELALFNKLGDLHVKTGNIPSAVDQYETAINHYAEQGFPNNAIALCNKVLRNSPGRTHIYLKLANLMMQRGFASEAKQNLLEYAERMQKAGKLEEAFHALKEFADLSPDNEEIRLLLADQLKKAARTDEAHEQLSKLYQELQQSDDNGRARQTIEKMRAIDPEYDLDAASPAAPPAKSKKGKTSDIVFLDLDEVTAPVQESDPTEQLPHEIEALDVEPTTVAEDAEDLVEIETDSDLDVEPTISEIEIDEDDEAVAPVEGLDVGDSVEADVSVSVDALDIESTALDDGLEVPELAEVDELPDLDVPTGPEEDDLQVPAGPDEDDLEIDELDEEIPSGRITQEQALADLPMLEVPDEEEEGVEVIGLDELREEEEAVAAAEDDEELDAIEVPSYGDVESLEVPWDVDEDDSSEESEEAPPVFASDDAAGGQPVATDDADLDVEIEMPDLGMPGVEDSAVEAEKDYEGVLAEAPAVDDGLDVDLDDEDIDIEDVEIDDDDLDIDVDERISGIELEAPEIEEPATPDISSLEAAVAENPDLPDPHRELGEALLELGERDRGIQELDMALEAYQVAGDMRHALDLVEELLRLDPNSVHHHQRRVEYALQRGDDPALVDAYLALADALVRNEELDRARFVYERVLERDPDNEAASIAIETLVPDAVSADSVEAGAETDSEQESVAVEEPLMAETETETTAAAEPEVSEPTPAEPVGGETPQQPVEAASEGFVDLGALIMDEEEEVKDTRMRIERDEPVEEEEQDFAEMLSEFKKGIEANIDADDAQAHYDLGVAFKEMGLLDEAISEFQKALRGSEDRLRTSESLGLCFYEKGQFAVAATVLRRAIESEPGSDDEKVGLLYWLGRCEEEQNRTKEALGYYQRIFSIDINFQDVSDRVNALTQASG